MRGRGFGETYSKAVVPFSILLLTGGCGLFHTKAPPTGHEHMTYFECTESNAGPTLDFALAGLQVFSTVSMATDEEELYPNSMITLGAIQAVLLTASGVSGRRKTARCREARKLLANRLAAEGPADPTLHSVRIDPSLVTLAVGEQALLTASARNSSQDVIPGRAFSWVSSDEAVASVNPAGLVTARAVGRVIIAANTGGVVGTAEVVVQGGVF